MSEKLGTIAFLTMESLEGFFSDDHLAVEALRTLGWDVEEVPWRSTQDWARFGGVLVRTPWDYHRDHEGFRRVLSEIEASGTNLQNPLSLIEWNMEKTYLLGLQEVVPGIPTIAGSHLARGEFARLFARLDAEEIVIKPQIGAGAIGAWRVSIGQSAVAHEIEEFYANRAWLAQPFIPGIMTSGEVSLIFFEGELSHVVRKVPKAGDYRVQEEHGGQFHQFAPPPELLELGRRLLASLRETPLYARVDCVELAPGNWALMEMELIEPSLYLAQAPGSAERFAQAAHGRFAARTAINPAPS